MTADTARRSPLISYQISEHQRLDQRRSAALEAELARWLEGTPAGRSLYAFSCATSTMEIAHDLAQSGAPEWTLVWAARQERGRGRQGRAWVSPEGGLYCSLILRPRQPSAYMSQLSLVAGLSVAEAIYELTSLFSSIRWPNDVLIQERKVAGILIEAKAEAVVVGIGINVTTNVSELPDTATSLVALTPHSALRTPQFPYQLTAALCRRLHAWYDVWRQQGFQPVREALRPRMGFFGRAVQLTAGSERFEGIANDLDETGRLLVRLDSGIVRPFEMGEVTLLR